jgi:hypothetical protein
MGRSCTGFGKKRQGADPPPQALQSSPRAQGQACFVTADFDKAPPAQGYNRGNNDYGRGYGAPQAPATAGRNPPPVKSEASRSGGREEAFAIFAYICCYFILPPLALGLIALIVYLILKA